MGTSWPLCCAQEGYDLLVVADRPEIESAASALRGLGVEVTPLEADLATLLRGEADVVSGWKNKVQTAVANVTPSSVLAEQHRKMAEPGSRGDKS